MPNPREAEKTGQDKSPGKEQVLYLQGSIVPMVTPLCIGVDNGIVVDEPSIGKLVDYLIREGSTGIFIMGTAGEFRSLGLKNKTRTITATVHSVSKRVPVLVGVSTETPEETEILAQYAEAEGADALVLAPMYGQGKPEEKLDLVKRITKLPIVLYNNPDIHDQKNLPLSLYETALPDPQVVGIKDSSQDQRYFGELLERRTKARPNFSVLRGYTNEMLSSLEQGANGTVCVIANVHPELLARLSLHPNQQTMQEILAASETLTSTKLIKRELVAKGIISSDTMST